MIANPKSQICSVQFLKSYTRAKIYMFRITANHLQLDSIVLESKYNVLGNQKSNFIMGRLLHLAMMSRVMNA